MTFLNQDIGVACVCCRLPSSFVTTPARPNHLEVTPQHKLCAPCMQHQSRAAAEKRNQSHVAMWQRVLTVERERYQGLLDQAEQQVEELTRELADRPVRVVEKDLDAERVDQARQQMEAAFRSRDHAYMDLVSIRLLHRDGGNGKCRCGRKSFSCKELQIVGRSDALDSWEKKQVDRARRGLDHLLPDNHPALSNRSWTGWSEAS